MNAGTLKTVEIDGLRFEFYRISPRELIALLWRIVGLLGMSLKTNGKADVGQLSVGDIVSNLFERCDEKTLYEVTDRLLTNTVLLADGDRKGGFLRDRATWDAAFSDSGGTMRFFKLVLAAMECYYGDFFADLAALFGVKKEDLSKTLRAAALETVKR